MSNCSYLSTIGIQAEDNCSNKILVYGISETLDMDLTSVKYEVPDTTVTQNTNFILSKFIQDTMVLILSTSTQVYAGSPYPMTWMPQGVLKRDCQTKLATSKSTSLITINQLLWSRLQRIEIRSKNWRSLFINDTSVRCNQQLNSKQKQ